jgi:hypothetical protein
MPLLYDCVGLWSSRHQHVPSCLSPRQHRSEWNKARLAILLYHPPSHEVRPPPYPFANRILGTLPNIHVEALHAGIALAASHTVVERGNLVSRHHTRLRPFEKLVLICCGVLRRIVMVLDVVGNVRRKELHQAPRFTHDK